MSPLPLPPAAASVAPGSWCESDGWCWYNPTLPINSFGGVAGVGRTDLWIGGDTPNLLRFDGGHWTVVPSPLAATRGIWGAAANDVWFVGYRLEGIYIHPAVAHWDGAAVTLGPATIFGSDILTDVWGSSGSDVYVTALLGSGVWHWNGNYWASALPARGTHIAGSGPHDIWVALLDGGAYHYDGMGWSPVPELEGVMIEGLAVTGPGDVWVLDTIDSGRLWLVHHLDASGLTLSYQTPVEFTDYPNAISASSNQDVWLVGYAGYLNHYDGQSWSRGPVAPVGLMDVSHTAGYGPIAVGESSAILPLRTAPALGFDNLGPAPTPPLKGVYGSSPQDMWAVGSAGTALHYDGRTVTSVPTSTTVQLRDVWGSGPDDVWAVGAAGTVIHHDGQMFGLVPSGTGADLNAVFTAGPGDVWIGGDGIFLHGDGRDFLPVAVPGFAAPMRILDLHGRAADDIWLSGGGPVAADGTVSGFGFLSHFDGTAWSPLERLTSDAGESTALNRVWEVAPDDIWVTSDLVMPAPGGGVYYSWHFDGQTWTAIGGFQMVTPGAYMFPDTHNGSFAFGPHDVWRVDDFYGSWQRNTR